jgi:LPXTG-motif cell wall-anchored protein
VYKDLDVVKEWANMEPTDFVTPTEKPVKVQLGYMVAEQFVPYGNPVTLLASGEWTHTYENLPTYALPSEELNLTDGSVVVYEIREVAEDDSLIPENGTINLGEDNRFTVNYSVSEDGQLVVTNTFDTPEKYYYRVDRHYYRNIYGTVATNDVVGDLVIVLPEENHDITIGAGADFVVDTNAYLVDGGYTHAFEKSIPTDVQVLELPNHEYVIHLYYRLVRSGGGGGGGGGGSTIIIPEPPVPLDPAPQPEPEVVIPEEDVPLVEIPEEEVPLVDVPKTGDASALWLMMSVLSGTGLAGVTFLGRKKREEV